MVTLSDHFRQTDPLFPVRPRRLRAFPVLIVILTLLLFGRCAGVPRTVALSPEFSPATPVAVIAIIDDAALQAAALRVTGAPSPGDIITEPVSMTVGPDGALIIADRATGHLIRLRADRTVESQVTAADPRGLSSMKLPRFVRSDLAGNVYVTDGQSEYVAGYDSRLRSIADVFPPYDALGQPLGQITGLAFGDYDEFYLVDRLNRQVHRFDATGRFMNDITGVDTPWIRFLRPMAAACSRTDGAVYVCDPGERRVAVFDNTGLALRTFGEGELIDPVAVAVDGRDQVYVADPGARLIHVFDHDGRYIGQLDGPRLGLPDFEAPTDVFVRGDLLYIAEPSRGRVLIVRIGGRLTGSDR